MTVDLDLYREAIGQAHDPADVTALMVCLRDELEESWGAWLRYLFPSYVTAGFAPHHIDFWNWVWALELDRWQQPGVGIWARGGAKSTSVELALAAAGARGRRRYVLYVCHETGTEVLDPDFGWMTVDEHPTATERRCDGLEVRVVGLPSSEVVTAEHRYWARRIMRRDRGHGRRVEITRGEPAWVEAHNLDRSTWLGLPIDTTSEVPESWPSPLLADPEWWWATGLWWGDGTLGGPQGRQISFALSDDHPAVRRRLLSLLDRSGVCWGERRGQGRLSSVSFWLPDLADWLRTWKYGNSRKTPPAWVEWLPATQQAALLRGYVDADGYVSARGVYLSGVHLPGLLAVRRMLARLGVACTISGPHRRGGGHIRGRAIREASGYALRFFDGRPLGLPAGQHRNQLRDVWIGEGHLWSRVKTVDPVTERRFVSITTSTGDYRTHFARSHNCDTQDQAEDHVGNVGKLLESPRVADLYPEIGEQLVNKFGRSRGWRRERLRSAAGFTVDAIGLDSAARGAKLDEERPDLIVFDDIDDANDSPKVTARKIDQLTRTFLPALAPNGTVLAVQNLVLPNGVFARIAGLAEQSADFLQDRVMWGDGPVPAVRGLVLGKDNDGLDTYLEGDIVWDGQGPDQIRQQIKLWGRTAFLIEAQHQVELRSGGKFAAWDWMKDHWTDGPMSYEPTVKRCRAWDQAGTEFDGKNDPDWTVGVRWAYDPDTHRYRIEDIVRFRHAAGTRDNIMRATARADADECGGIDAVTHLVERRPGDLGRDEADRLVREVFAGFRATKVSPIGTKEDRAAGMASAMENGLVTIVEQAPDRDGHRSGSRVFLAELEGFPLGDHDDQVDAGAHGFNWIRQEGATSGGISAAAGAAAGSLRR